MIKRLNFSRLSCTALLISYFPATIIVRPGSEMDRIGHFGKKM
jgi:hypothetical protein